MNGESESARNMCLLLVLLNKKPNQSFFLTQKMSDDSLEIEGYH